MRTLKKVTIRGTAGYSSVVSVVVVGGAGTAVAGSAGGFGRGSAGLSAAGGADAELMRLELRRIFNEIAKRLTPQQRAAFTLREIEGVSTEEIARIMSTRPSTVRNHLMAARRALQEALKRRYPEYFRTKERG